MGRPTGSRNKNSYQPFGNEFNYGVLCSNQVKIAKVDGGVVFGQVVGTFSNAIIMNCMENKSQNVLQTIVPMNRIDHITLGPGVDLMKRKSIMPEADVDRGPDPQFPGNKPRSVVDEFPGKPILYLAGDITTA